ncbi:hypothetical protein J2S74_002064 [Evansella vedderi]|uniref:Uncharacterized protein n=1 Tax=Evansella vedderi TaxID=38282 RepID=A0ABT9ZTW5_9BACI|nr:hypothetical protein [Evansella vedderi]MDQ0254685.1 hypothetical protein [Evansella vedderi]
MKKFLIGILFTSTFVVTVPFATDVVDEVVNSQTTEVAYADASFRVRSVDSSDLN